jgi:Glycine rich protein
MRAFKGPGGVLVVMMATVGALAAGSGVSAAGAETVSQTFVYTGAEQTFVVPAGVHSVQVLAVGGHGGRAGLDPIGGVAAQVTGALTVRPGETLYVEVGGNGAPGEAGSQELHAGGFNGGGDGAGGGGGASDVRSSLLGAGLSPDDRLLVAGGGGGAGVSGYFPGGFGGAAGEPGWRPGGNPGEGENGYGGNPGSASSGGSGGGSGFGCGPGESGRIGAGGNALPASCRYPGGGGGGGYYGGGAGNSASEGGEFSGGAGGGGGSSLVPVGGTLTLTTRSEYNVYTPEPEVQISYTPEPPCERDSGHHRHNRGCGHRHDRDDA